MRHNDDRVLLDRLTGAIAAGDSFVLPVFALGEAWRVVTERRGYAAEPVDVIAALTVFLETMAVARPGARYLAELTKLLEKHQPHGAEVFDFQIAAVCIEHSVPRLWTFDARFPRIAGLEVVRPLV